MKKSGPEFRILNNLIQPLLPQHLKGGPFTHLMTIGRIRPHGKPMIEYCLFRNEATGLVYLERFNGTNPNFFERIEDQTEWSDLNQFLVEAKHTKISADTEIRIAKP